MTVINFRKRKRARRTRSVAIFGGVFVATIGVGSLAGFAADGFQEWMAKPASSISQCVAIDGDTLKCGAERVRLLGIDAPEMPGHCRQGRRCAPGDPMASRDALAAAIGDGVQINNVGSDRYGRTLAVVSSGGINLSCRQLERGHAIYRRDWDNGARIAMSCPLATL